MNLGYQNSTPDNYVLDDYFIFRKDRNSRGGGVLIAVKNVYKCNEKSINSEKEDICVEVFVKNRKLLFYTLYKAPNVSIDFDSHFKRVFESIDTNNYHFICIERGLVFLTLLDCPLPFSHISHTSTYKHLEI